jgi:hypothetical protein
MTLEELRIKLVAAKTTGISQVVFDYSSYINQKGSSKTYPIALWDFDNIEGTQNLGGDQEKLITMNCWCIGSVAPEADIVNRHLVWDSLETAFKAYLVAVQADGNITIQNSRNMPFEYFPAGLLSLEREMGVRYRVELKLWCYDPPT